MSPPALHAPLARAAQFQAAWFYTILGVFGLAFTAWGVYQVARTLRAMLREGDVLLFTTCVALLTVTLLLFVSMTAMALISLGPPLGNAS